MLFLNERGLIITPSFGLDIDADGNITTTYFPAGHISTASAGPSTISVGDYAEFIKDYLAG